MDKEYAYDFWKKYLSLLFLQHESIAENPAIDFTKKAKAGMYDDISDSAYSKILNHIEEVSSYCRQQATASTKSIIINALEEYITSEEKIDTLSKTLASLSIDHTPTSDKAKVLGNEIQKAERRLSLTPHDIYDKLSEDIFGQEEAKKAIATFAYNFINGHPNSLLMVGQTGSGKTEFIRSLQRIFPDDKVRVIDGARIAPDGYKASEHISSWFTGDPDKDDYVICVCDEFCKLATEIHINSNGTDYTKLAMDQFLKLLDRDVLTFTSEETKKTFTVDPKHIAFLFLGAFETLLTRKTEKSKSLGFGSDPITACDYSNTAITMDDLIKAGVRPEIAGRIDQIVQLEAPTKYTFRKILDSPMSPINRIGTAYGVKLSVSDALKEELAEQADKSGLGCRAIYSNLRRRLNNQIFIDCNKDEYYLDVL